MAQDNAGNTPEIWEPAELEERFGKLVKMTSGPSVDRGGWACPKCGVPDRGEEDNPRRLFNHVVCISGVEEGVPHAFETDARSNLTGVMRRGDAIKEVLAHHEDGEPKGWELLTCWGDLEADENNGAGQAAPYCADCGEPAGMAESFREQAENEHREDPPVRGGSLPEIWDVKDIKQEYPLLVTFGSFIAALTGGLECTNCGCEGRFNFVMNDPSTGDIEALEMTSDGTLTGGLRRGEAAWQVLSRPRHKEVEEEEGEDRGPLAEESGGQIYCAECGR